MKNELAIQNSFSSIINGSIDSMTDAADNMMKIVIDGIKSNFIDGLYESFCEQTSRFEAISNYLEIYDNPEKQQVYYYSSIRTMIELIINLYNNQHSDNRLHEILSYPHMPKILTVLNQYNSLPHGKLAEKAGLSKSNLSNFFSRTNRFNLWKAEHKGKYTYYTITSTGKQAYKLYFSDTHLKNDSQSTNFIIIILNEIANELSSEKPDVQNVITNINKRNGGTVSITASPMFSFELRRIFLNKQKNELNRKKKMHLYKKDFSLPPDFDIYKDYLEFKFEAEYKEYADKNIMRKYSPKERVYNG